MSFLRLLSHARRDPTRWTSAPTTHPILTLNVPGYGAFLMRPPPEFDYHEGRVEPRSDRVINGDLQVMIAPGTGRKRCQSIRVGIRTRSKLDLGPGRMGEEDVIFERKVEIRGGTVDVLWLEEGLQRCVSDYLKS